LVVPSNIFIQPERHFSRKALLDTTGHVFLDKIPAFKPTRITECFKPFKSRPQFYECYLALHGLAGLNFSVDVFEPETRVILIPESMLGGTKEIASRVKMVDTLHYMYIEKRATRKIPLGCKATKRIPRLTAFHRGEHLAVISTK
jgi:hypothetical protein